MARSYRRDGDYERVGEFLVRTYRTSGTHINWLQPRWEYMHFHPLVRDVDLSTIGIWEAAGELVGVIHPEHSTGRVYVELDDAHAARQSEMLAYAEEHLALVSDEGRELTVYVNDADHVLKQLAADRGYVRTGGTESMAHMDLTGPLPRVALPDGFRLQSLAEENDLWKIHGVLWRGFDHGDDPPRDELPDRAFMQSAPNFRHDLNVVTVAPDGAFASYGGTWFEPRHRIAYVEPVATVPRYRRRGLGRAAVLEGLRRCRQLGARVAYVGSAIPIYVRLGFRPLYTCSAWRRRWRGAPGTKGGRHADVPAP